jgi:hypothetical protein
MAVDSALGNSVPVSLHDISKIDCHNAFFRNSHGDEVPELDRLSVKTWHIAMSHCFSQLNDAIRIVRDHIGENGKLDNPKNFLDDLKTAQAISGDVYVNASLYRTTFEQRLMELKAKEVVYYAEASKLAIASFANWYRRVASNGSDRDAVLCCVSKAAEAPGSLPRPPVLHRAHRPGRTSLRGRRR